MTALWVAARIVASLYLVSVAGGAVWFGWVQYPSDRTDQTAGAIVAALSVLSLAVVWGSR